MLMENKSHLFVSSWYSSFFIQFLNLFINFIFLLFFYFFFLELLFFHLWKLIYKDFSPKQMFQFVSTQKLCISTLGVTHLKKEKKYIFFPGDFFWVEHTKWASVLSFLSVDHVWNIFWKQFGWFLFPFIFTNIKTFCKTFNSVWHMNVFLQFSRHKHSGEKLVHQSTSSNCQWNRKWSAGSGVGPTWCWVCKQPV